MKSSLRSLLAISVLAALPLALVTPTAHAKPEFSAKEKQGCVTCHAMPLTFPKPALNDVGACYKHHAFSDLAKCIEHHGSKK